MTTKTRRLMDRSHHPKVPVPMPIHIFMQQQVIKKGGHEFEKEGVVIKR